MQALKLDFLDHVAIRVKDLEISATWYQRVLGLKKYQLPQWGSFPIMMLAGKSGIALFPANLEDKEIDPTSRNIKIDHYAFNVTRSNFEIAQKRFQKLGIEYTVKDHTAFHSIYIEDPDGHTVELTTLVVDPDTFY